MHPSLGPRHEPCSYRQQTHVPLTAVVAQRAFYQRHSSRWSTPCTQNKQIPQHECARIERPQTLTYIKIYLHTWKLWANFSTRFWISLRFEYRSLLSQEALLRVIQSPNSNIVLSTFRTNRHKHEPMHALSV